VTVFNFFALMFWLQKLSILCFRHEEHNSSETPKPEIIDHCFHEELVQSESRDPDVVKRDWKSVVPKVVRLLFTLKLMVFCFQCGRQFKYLYSLSLNRCSSE